MISPDCFHPNQLSQDLPDYRHCRKLNVTPTLYQLLEYTGLKRLPMFFLAKPQRV